MTSANLTSNQWSVAVKSMVHNAVTTCQSQEVSVVTNQTTCRNQELQTYLTRTVVNHVDHFGFASAQTFHNRAHAFFRNVNHKTLKWLRFNTIDFFNDYLWFRNLHFITFTTHILDQNTKVKLTASRNDKCIRTIRFIHTQTHICLKFFKETLTQFTGSYPFTFFTSKRTVIHKESHLHRRLVDLKNRQCFWIRWISNGLTNVNVLDPCDSNDIPCARFFCFNTF
ncbi:hypothetical protein D3C71_1075920 [compost metagenome]